MQRRINAEKAEEKCYTNSTPMAMNSNDYVINYTMLGQNREADNRGSAQITEIIQNEFKDVFLKKRLP